MVGTTLGLTLKLVLLACSVWSWPRSTSWLRLRRCSKIKSRRSFFGWKLLTKLRSNTLTHWSVQWWPYGDGRWRLVSLICLMAYWWGTPVLIYPRPRSTCLGYSGFYIESATILVKRYHARLRCNLRKNILDHVTALDGINDDMIFAYRSLSKCLSAKSLGLHQ